MNQHQTELKIHLLQKYAIVYLFSQFLNTVPYSLLSICRIVRSSMYMDDMDVHSIAHHFTYSFSLSLSLFLPLSLSTTVRR